MLRFIIEAHRRDDNQGTDWRNYYTIDVDVPELEDVLNRGGYGEMGFERHELKGVEILAHEEDSNGT